MLYSDIELVVRRTKMLETRLKRVLDAKEGGLGPSAHSVKAKLPKTTFQQLEQVIRIRNEIVHVEGRNKLKNRVHFEQLCNDIERSLDKLENPKQALARDWGCLVILFIFALLIYFLSQNPL